MTLAAAVPPREWRRDDWVAFADRLLAGARRWASAHHARITPPGPPGGYGTDVDGLEGFARTFLIAGALIAGERGTGVDNLIDDYAAGIAAGVDPGASDRWVRLDEHPQAKVEAASIALMLDLTRAWLWDRLDGLTQARVIDYLAPAVGDQSYPRTNWLWFRIVVQTFLRSVGGPWSARDIADDLALHDTFRRDGGWISDGDERAFDHYCGWALQLYPVLWSRMSGAADLAAGRTARDIATLDAFLQDAVCLIGGDGSPLIQGRSLIYRFAAAAPFWAGVIAGVPSVPAGQLRYAAFRIVDHFAARGVPDASDLLTVGWHQPWPALAQSYSGPASPYWAAKGLLGISLPADHPVWDAPAQPLPIDGADHIRTVDAAGWVVSGTVADGVVRVFNHGTDHAVPGARVGDSPLYARIGYSTATSPMMDERSWAEPVDMSVAVIDHAGRATHRAGFDTLVITDDRGDGVAVAGSVARAHWLAPADDQVRHGSGLVGAAEVAATVTTVSLVRAGWEVRLIRLDPPDPVDPAPGGVGDLAAVRVGGWPISGPGISVSTGPDDVAVAGPGLVSSIRTLSGTGIPEIVERAEAGPLGTPSVVPVLTFPAVVGSWLGALVGLTGAGPSADGTRARLELHEDADAIAVRIRWPDGAETSTAVAVDVIRRPGGSVVTTGPNPGPSQPAKEQYR